MEKKSRKVQQLAAGCAGVTFIAVLIHLKPAWWLPISLLFLLLSLVLFVYYLALIARADLKSD